MSPPPPSPAPKEVAVLPPPPLSPRCLTLSLRPPPPPSLYLSIYLSIYLFPPLSLSRKRAREVPGSAALKYDQCRVRSISHRTRSDLIHGRSISPPCTNDPVPSASQGLSAPTQAGPIAPPSPSTPPAPNTSRAAVARRDAWWAAAWRGPASPGPRPSTRAAGGEQSRSMDGGPSISPQHPSVDPFLDGLHPAWDAALRGEARGALSPGGGGQVERTMASPSRDQHYRPYTRCVTRRCHASRTVLRPAPLGRFRSRPSRARVGAARTHSLR